MNDTTTSDDWYSGDDPHADENTHNDPNGDGKAGRLAGASKAISVAGKAAGAAGHGALKLGQGAGYALQGAGDAGMRFFREHPGLLKWLKPLGAAGLMNALENVDINAAIEDVRELQAQYPGESPAQISHRLTVKKAIHAGGVGLATSAVPGVSILLAPLDWKISATLQAELAYQIAAAYGMNLRDPARQTEIAAIFGVAFGGAKAAGILGKKIVQGKIASKIAGKVAAKEMPLFGAAIGAGTNAMMLFALGHAARRYYESQSKGQAAPLIISDAQDDSESFLDHAAQQDDIFHRVLAHVARAGYPALQWTQIENGLRLSGMSEAALNVMGDEFAHPRPLQEWLAQLDCDFATALLTQCRRIANLDGVVNDEEQRIIHSIEQHCAKAGVTQL